MDTKTNKRIKLRLVALDRLLGSTELNLDEMEPETVAAIVFAEAVRKLVKGEKP
jgi:hypothetical protein